MAVAAVHEGAGDRDGLPRGDDLQQLVDGADRLYVVDKPRSR
jgi:hypothetical protein